MFNNLNGITCSPSQELFFEMLTLSKCSTTMMSTFIEIYVTAWKYTGLCRGWWIGCEYI